MERSKIIRIGVIAAVVLSGIVIIFGLRKPKGPDCSLIARAHTQSARPVAALAPLLNDDPKGLQTDMVAKAMAALVDVARVPGPLPDFSKSSVPDAVKDAETASQVWLKCGANAVVWGTVEYEGDQLIVEKKGRDKKPTAKPVYGILLWVTGGPDQTLQIPRTRDGREAGEAVFRMTTERSRGETPAAASQLPAQPNREAPLTAAPAAENQQKP
jgi:hypothetical protein